MIQLAAFWKKESKNNRTYYTGKLGKGKLLLFENDRKEKDEQPDLILYVVEEENKTKGKTFPERE